MKKISFIFIIIGFVLIAIPPIGQLYNSYTQNKLLAEWSVNEDNTNQNAITGIESAEEDYKQLQESFESEKNSQFEYINRNMTATSSSITITTSNSAIVPKTAHKTTPKPVKSKTSQIILGVIKIDKIKVNKVIVEGSKPENLRIGIGHLPGTSVIGQPGNCVLAGHRSHTFGYFFNRLDELIEGDDIIISTKKSTYIYTVYQKLVVTPDDVSVLKNSKDDSIITLITCTPVFHPTHRLIIHARIKDQK